MRLNPPGAPAARPRRRAATAAALAAVTATLAAVAACAPPSSSTSTSASGSAGGAVSAAGATSAQALGGMDALVAAANKEGTLNVIALPPDWANYGEIITAFKAKYGDQGRRRPSPTPAARTRSTPRTQLKGSRPRPDVFDLGQSVALAQHRHVRAVQGRRPGPTSPTTLKDADRRLGQRLRRLHVDRLRPPRCPRPTTVADLLKPEYKGKVALNGDPTQAGAAFSGVHHGVARQRRLGRRHRPGRRLLQEAQGGRQLPAGRPDAGDDRVRADPGRHRLGLPERRAGQDAQDRTSTGRSSCRRTPSSAATTSRRSTRTPRTRPPPGCGRSTSTATRARTCGSRAAPARSAPTR